MTCEECEPLLVDLLYEELDAEASAHVRVHLAGCSECAQAYAELQSTLEFVDRLPLEAPSPRVEDGIMEAARDKAAQVGSGGGHQGLHSPHLAMAAAAMLVVAVGVYAGFPRSAHEASELGASEPTSAAKAPPSGVAETESRDSEAVTRGAQTPTLMQDEAESTGVVPAPPVKKRTSPTARRSRNKARMQAQGAASLRQEGTARAASRESMEDALRGGTAPGPAEARAGAEMMGEADLRAAKRQAAPPELLSRARALRAADDCLSAVRLYERFIKKYQEHPAASEAKLEAGLCYRRLGRSARARHFFSEAAKDDVLRARAERELEAMREGSSSGAE